MQHTDDQPEPQSSRRQLLRLGTAAALGAGSLAVAGGRPAGAAIGDPVLLGSISNDAVGTSTVVSSTTSAATFGAVNTSPSTAAGTAAISGLATGGHGVLGVAGSGVGVRGETTSGWGIVGVTTDNGTAMQAQAGAGVIGRCFVATILSASNYHPAILASTSGTGHAIEASNTASKPTINADNTGTGHAVYGQATSGSGAGIYGDHSGDGPGVRGRSVNGRGGKFSGAKAQIQLVKGGARPSSGAAGDIFFDSASKLWVCKGGKSWVQIA